MKLALLMFVAAGLASADPITVTLDNPIQIGSSGDILNFTGILTNTSGGILFINSDSFSVDSPLIGDDSPFLNNAPISLDAATASSSFLMFTVTIPNATPNSVYNGDIHVLGGATDGDAIDLGSATFSVTVGAAVPEPAAGLLLIVPLFGLVLRKKLVLRPE